MFDPEPHKQWGKGVLLILKARWWESDSKATATEQRHWPTLTYTPLDPLQLSCVEALDQWMHDSLLWGPRKDSQARVFVFGFGLFKDQQERLFKIPQNFTWSPFSSFINFSCLNTCLLYTIWAFPIFELILYIRSRFCAAAHSGTVHRHFSWGFWVSGNITVSLFRTMQTRV